MRPREIVTLVEPRKFRYIRAILGAESVERVCDICLEVYEAWLSGKITFSEIEELQDLARARKLCILKEAELSPWTVYSE